MGVVARDRTRVAMIHSFVKTVTAAALLGLVVLHPAPFEKILSTALDTFRKAVTLA